MIIIIGNKKRKWAYLFHEKDRGPPHSPFFFNYTFSLLHFLSLFTINLFNFCQTTQPPKYQSSAAHREKRERDPVPTFRKGQIFIFFCVVCLGLPEIQSCIKALFFFLFFFFFFFFFHVMYQNWVLDAFCCWFR